ncbi:hypothetical protein SARC_03222 [Sphaeroforma arctica JP610]|uniref:Uncharacterized protein n=1 Tax=Sphaeroforma arctica JP610 TaxID=667725 RepID=A0A0L0G6G8_9EUKA|nr:hypothetical protein SARC_03222 [Sphaeroforma arctica JP610]KNC84549.1 hypothetical protein SARC_03222 [Sphaeroforma arctica JP610]|eukprot:XP_014158451.1 hypothetical protein SARC_03222 [Sphaeroforma arctica JP610]
MNNSLENSENVNLGIPASANRTSLMVDTNAKGGPRRNRSFSFQEAPPRAENSEGEGSIGTEVSEFVDEDFDSPNFDLSTMSSRVSIVSSKVVKVIDKKPSIVSKYMCGNNVVVQAITGTLILCAAMAITLFVLSWGYI